MPSYVEGDNIAVVVDGSKTFIKPILFTTYDSETKYNLHITYEDSTTKEVEVVQNCMGRPYKFIYKKEGKLLSSIGIPKIYEINEGNKYVDFPNKVMDSSDLLFVLDCSEKFQHSEIKFYLKDIRDIIDLANEEDPDDPMEIFPVTTYPIYLNNHSCENTIKLYVTKDNMDVTLTPTITKLGDPLSKDDYSDCNIIKISEDIVFDINDDGSFKLHMTDETVDKEFKVTIRCYIKEIKHPVFDEFTILVEKKDNIVDIDTDNTDLLRAITTQDTQYLGDGALERIGNDLTPGFKPYKYQTKKEHRD